jgi:hypothetical protein
MPFVNEKENWELVRRTENPALDRIIIMGADWHLSSADIFASFFLRWIG